MRVNFRVQIHSSFSSISTGDKFVRKSCEMPFPPTIGMSIILPEVGEVLIEEDSLPLGGLSFDTLSQEFNVYLENKEIYNAQLHRRSTRTIDEIYKEYIKEGWEPSD